MANFIALHMPFKAQTKVLYITLDIYSRVIRKPDICQGHNTINLSELTSGGHIFVVEDQRYLDRRI